MTKPPLSSTPDAIVTTDRNFFIADELLEAGFTQVPNLILRNPALTLQAKALWAILYSHYNRERGIFPGRDVLADEAGCHVNTIDKHIGELKDAGYLTTKRRGLGLTNAYTLHAARTTNSGNQETHLGVTPDSHSGVSPIIGKRTIPSEQEEPSVSKPPPKTGNQTVAIVEAYCRHTGVERLANYAKGGAAAKKLAEAGIIPDDIPALYDYVAHWAGSADLNLMLAQADKWRASVHAPPPKRMDDLPPHLRARLDGWLREQAHDGLPAEPYPPGLQRDIDAWRAAR